MFLRLDQFAHWLCTIVLCCQQWFAWRVFTASMGCYFVASVVFKWNCIIIFAFVPTFWWPTMSGWSFPTAPTCFFCVRNMPAYMHVLEALKQPYLKGMTVPELFQAGMVPPLSWNMSPLHSSKFALLRLATACMPQWSKCLCGMPACHTKQITLSNIVTTLIDTWVDWITFLHIKVGHSSLFACTTHACRWIYVLSGYWQHKSILDSTLQKHFLLNGILLNWRRVFLNVFFFQCVVSD